MTLTTPLASLGRQVLAALAAIGRIALFAGSAIGHLFRPPYYPREFLLALMQIGYFSLPVVGLTTLFTGGALALQIWGRLPRTRPTHNPSSTAECVGIAASSSNRAPSTSTAIAGPTR